MINRSASELLDSDLVSRAKTGDLDAFETLASRHEQRVYSLILVDFIEIRRAQGMSLADAVVEAGLIRFRPILLTAMAVVVGASVILFDPIFQGLAISLMAGNHLDVNQPSGRAGALLHDLRSRAGSVRQ